MNSVYTYGKSATVLVLLVGFSITAVAADLITGSVQNKTRGVAAAGEDVILLRLEQGMQEEARVKTNEQGAFSFKAQFPDKPYLVRVVHQGVNYDERASTTGDALTVDVFDAASRVQGVSGTVEIIRTGTKGNMLHVSDILELQNESNPPLTQMGERTLEVFLPAKARIASVVAVRSGKIPVLITAAPVPGEPGHFTMNFPLRPGLTRFGFDYNVPYDGHATFQTRLAYPVSQLGIMIPPTMKFKSSSPAFRILNTGDEAYQLQVANQLKAGEGPAFEISGAGDMPPLRPPNQAHKTAPSAPAVNPAGSAAVRPAAPAANNFASQPQAPVPAPAPAKADSATPAPETPAVSPREWWLLGGAAILVFGACGFAIWRTQRRAGSRAEIKAKTGAPTNPLLEALKQELLDLETSRLQGSISSEEYDEAKKALDGTVRRALARAATKP